MPGLYLYRMGQMLSPGKNQRRLLAGMCLLSMLGSSCSIPYYWQAVDGQLRIVNGRERVDHVLRRPDLPPELHARLELSQEVLEFAYSELRLPDNGSYTSYYDTGQPYVVWNVFAAPEFSLEPQTWCFPVAGCIAYKGYFKENKARKYADKLAADGADVYVGGVAAYSTLGRFRDPLLNTMLNMDAADFTGLIFHELAHQQLYVQDDSAFNEGFATAVEREGLRRWQLARGLAGDIAAEAYNGQQRQAVMDLLADARAALASLYASELEIEQKRLRKQTVFVGLAAAYADLADSWGRDGFRQRPYGGLFEAGLNNASLGAIATYADYVPAFNRLLADCAGALDCFYARAAELAALEPDSRDSVLNNLAAAQIAGVDQP